MDIVAKRRIFLTISVVLVALSAIVLGTEGLNLGIDFTSGSTVTYQFGDTDPGTADVTDALTASGHPESIIQALGDNQYFIRTDDLGVSGLDDVNEEILKLDPDAHVLDTSTVGSSVAEDTVSNAITAVIVAAIFVMIYIMYAFRSVPNSYKYAFAAIVALMHDVLIVLGAFAVLGIAINAEVNAIFIVGILTVIGYSVNDTIVIFDRIRENVTLAPGRDFRTTVNISINESFTRSLGTSITTMTVILAMLLFGGASLRDFLIVLLSGVIVGTYSSIFIAAQVLVLWERRAFLPWRKTAATNS
ncbi:protein translocase subunit SecF [Candidatus Lucifugimonas marina]|jgi:preprotein translocase subunit SecF|uniref:Protein-export membrane protein SecF n=1 Tax=Candidatus Lucifugimonas marina TaxID=3038979 RepID=A0AAJ6CUX4_9CHLR|nr:protein translocase subunit SecF [SAR202 cluster bacterium JH702]MDG0869159.1 protein translocase subunit SecF [SAR202 cluster bacterium JH639]WFG35779.1 protein translocase subunit SecF [SAR202 cluster bacterium JH545]WFG39724.1 protein translocase subunit SecF [SAR202 cluster bacterium JH1073]